MVGYAAIGCSHADLPSVPGAKVDVASDGKTAVVECDRGQRDGYVRWSLKCVVDKWHGNVGNCTGAAVADGSQTLFSFRLVLVTFILAGALGYEIPSSVSVIGYAHPVLGSI